MVDYFYKGLIFAPVYACVVYAVIFLINWKRLHMSQRIFTFSLFAVLSSLLLYQCIIMEDLETCKTLVFLNSFTGPALVILFFLFTYSQMQTKSIFRPRLLPLYAIPFLSFGLLAASFVFGSSGDKEIEEIAYSVVYSTSDLKADCLVEFQYLLYRLILIFGSIAVAFYYIYKIRWYEKLAQKFIADSDSAVMPMSKQLTLTFFLFVAVTLAQFFKKVVPEDYYIIGAEIYGVFMVGLIIHTCRAVHHGYTRMPIEGEEAEQIDAETQFLYDSFDEKTWSLSSNNSIGNTVLGDADMAKDAVKQDDSCATGANVDTAKSGDQVVPIQNQEEKPEPEVSTLPETSVEAQQQATDENTVAMPSAKEEEKLSATTEEECEQKAETCVEEVGACAEGVVDDVADANKRNVLEYVQSSEIEQQLKKVMIVKKLYMQRNITIKDVANAIGTNHYYLSVYMNRVLKTSFSDYINRLRIEREVLPRIEKNPQISTKELIIAGNFSHRTTFYRAFQKVMGMTFQEYKAKMNG